MDRKLLHRGAIGAVLALGAFRARGRDDHRDRPLRVDARDG